MKHKKDTEYLIDGEECTYDDLLEIVCESEGYHNRRILDQAYTAKELVQMAITAGYTVIDIDDIDESGWAGKEPE